MPVSYTKEQKDKAKADELHLVTVAAAGLVFQEAVPNSWEDEVAHFVLHMRAKYRESPYGRAATPQLKVAVIESSP